jgi:antitoxin Phd
MAQKYTLTDLNNRAGEVIEAAIRGPVDITKHGKRKFVILSADRYDEIIAQGDVRRAYHVDDMPSDVAEMVLAGLEREDD